MEQWQVELIERVTRIEANQEYMKASIRELPQSQKCERDIKELKQEIEVLQAFKDVIQQKIAYIGGVIVVIGLFVPSAIKWVMEHLHFKL